MTVYALTTFDDANYRESVILDGTPYVLAFALNQRENTYYLSISASDGTPLVSGLKVLSNWPMLHGFVDARLPPGELIPLTAADDASPPEPGELGTTERVTLYYFDASEALR